MAAAQIIERADNRFECLGEAFVEQRARIDGHDLAGIDAVHAKTHAAVYNGRFELNFIAVAPIVLGAADGLHQLVDLLRANLPMRSSVERRFCSWRRAVPCVRDCPRAAAADAHEGAGG